MVSFGVEDFVKRYGALKPSQFVDVVALSGDKADNIPGSLLLLFCPMIHASSNKFFPSFFTLVKKNYVCEYNILWVGWSVCFLYMNVISDYYW